MWTEPSSLHLPTRLRRVCVPGASPVGFRIFYAQAVHVTAECLTETIPAGRERVGWARHASRASARPARRRGEGATGFSHLHLLVFFLEPNKTDDGERVTQTPEAAAALKCDRKIYIPSSAVVLQCPAALALGLAAFGCFLLSGAAQVLSVFYRPKINSLHLSLTFQTRHLSLQCAPTPAAPVPPAPLCLSIWTVPVIYQI